MGQVAFMLSHLSRQSLWKVCVQSMHRSTDPGMKSSRQMGHLQSLSGAIPLAPTTEVPMDSICSSVAPAHQQWHMSRMSVKDMTSLIVFAIAPLFSVIIKFRSKVLRTAGYVNHLQQTPR